MATKTAHELSTETLLDWYHRMSLMREFENNAEQSYQEGHIAGYHHVYSGQEAVAVGTFAHLRKDDHIITTYRDHGPALARGIDPKAAMAELYGKATGTSKGKGGSMHLASRELNFWGGYAIVAGHLPLGTGIALAEQYRGTNNITICMFGDGASNNGYFHESLNLAKIWELPIIYLCENNRYAMWTAFEDVSALTDVYKKARGYDIPAKQIDGMDVLAVYEGISEAIDYVRAGKGPYFIEAKTYRYRGHGPGDIEKYRTKEEVAEYRKLDPIMQLAEYLTLKRQVSEQRLHEIQEDVEQRIKEVLDFAMNSPEPELSTLWKDIFYKPFPNSMSPNKGLS